MKLTPKNTIVWGKRRGISNKEYNSISLVIHEPIQNFKFVALLLLCYLWLLGEEFVYFKGLAIAEVSSGANKAYQKDILY